MSHVISAQDLAFYEHPEQYWVLPGLLPKPGLLVILGSPRAGKSYLALQTAMAIAQGQQLFPNHPKSKPHSVLYFYQDKTGPFVFQERLRSLHQQKVSLSGPLFFPHPKDHHGAINILEPDCYRYFADMIKAADPDVVVFDVLREFHNMDENDSTQMKIVGDAITTMCHGRAIIIVHHTKKLDYQKSQGITVKNIDASRGSNYIPGKADFTWLIDSGTLNVEGNYAPAETHTIVQSPTGLWRFTS